VKQPAANSTVQEPRYWGRAANEVFVGQFVPFSSLVTPHDVITRGGDFFRIWRLGGIAFETSDESWIADRHEALCSLLRNLSGGHFALWTHRLHRVIETPMDAIQSPRVAAEFDEAYRRKLSSKRMMANELYFTVLYRAAARGAARVFETSRKSEEQVHIAQADALRVLDEKSAMISRLLREFDPHLLGDYVVEGITYSEVAEFLGYLVNGTWRRTRVPRGPLYKLLPKTRLFFGGDKIELREADRTRYAAVVDIQEYPAVVQPGVMDALLYEDSEFIETQSFSMLPRRDALRALELQKGQLIASDDVVESQIQAMDVAMNNVGDGQYSMGEYHYSLMVFGEDVIDAGRRAAAAAGAMGEVASVEMVPVDLISDAAWFAQWPGNFRWRPREAKISSRAFAAMAAQHNFMLGKRDGNPWGPAVMVLRTPSGQPYYLNLHVSPEKEDSEDKKLPGNTLILGVTGAGKTTLEMAILLQSQRFLPPPRLVVFDFDRGCEIAVRALRGRYFQLELGTPTGCNPLQREPTPSRIKFWETLVKKCIETPAMPLYPKDERAIALAIRAVADMPRAARTFTTLRQNLPTDGLNSLYERLGRWCRGGPNGWVFDEADDRLTDLADAHVIGFDYTEFLDDQETGTPVLMYLMDVMKDLIDGRRLMYLISEFWKALGDPVFSDFAKREQKTIRKKNGLGLFDTQSPSDVLNSDIGRTMVEQSVTKICLPNPEAVREEYVEGFGLSNAEYETVKSLGSQGGRKFLVKQDHRSAICELDLSGLDDFILLMSGSPDNVALLDEIRQQEGDDPDVWIPILRERVRLRTAAGRRTGTRGGNRR
jgi:type IV secretion system protein VirB4